MVARLRVRDASGVLRTIIRARVRDATGTLRTIQRIRVRDAAGVLRTVFQYLTVEAIPTEVSGSYNGSSAAPQDITTASTIASVTGGTAPFTYSWAQVGVSPYTFVINSPAAATTSFTGQSIPIGADTNANFECTVTDANGNVVVSNLVNAFVYNNSTA